MGSIADCHVFLMILYLIYFYKSTNSESVNVTIFCDSGISPNMTSAFPDNNYVNNFSLSYSCEKDIYYLNNHFRTKDTEIYIGSMDLDYNTQLLKYATLHEGIYVSPYPIENNGLYEATFLSVGGSFEDMASAFSVVLTHFRWRHVYIVAEIHEFWLEMADAIFINLAQSGFQPKIVRARNPTGNTTLSSILEEVGNEHKAISLCMGSDMKRHIIQEAANKGMHQYHVFFGFGPSPYKQPDPTHLTELNTTEHKRALSNVFEIYPVFKSSNVTSNVSHSTILQGKMDLGTYDADITDGTDANNDTVARDRSVDFIWDVLELLDTILHTDIVTADVFKSVSMRTFQTSSSRTMTFNKASVSVLDYILYDFDPNTWKYIRTQKIVHASERGWQLQGLAPVLWPDGAVIGADECFHPEKCQSRPGMDALYVLAIGLAVLVVAGVSTVVVVSVWRRLQQKEISKGHKLLLTNNDLVFLQRKDLQKGSSKIMNGTIPDKPDLLKAAEKPSRSMASLHEHADITDTARFNGDLVHVKEIRAKGFEVKTKVLNVIKMVRDIRHENVNSILGFYDDPRHPAIISDFCSRASLEDVLRNSDIKLDWDFKVSLLTDLIRGVRFIHNSPIRWHGNLKCRNCLIDSRWVLKVSDFGLSTMYESAKVAPHLSDEDLLCTAPEHLRQPGTPLKGSEKGDVYSISIIMQCVVLRSEPYSTAALTPKDIIHKLKHPPPLLRPSVSHGTAPPQYIQLMKVCWSENPDMRPTLDEIYQQFKTITGGKKMNIVDTMFRMLEKYSTDLEDLVKERTLQLEEEKKKTDLLLYRMLPPIVADSLKIGSSVAAEQFSEVTIYFSDIVGFTTISANSTPMQVVDLLNDLYTMFDATIDSYDVYKVETIGDAYMVCSGLPLRNENRHAGEIGTMALDLLSQCGSFTIKHMPEVPLRVRIGLHSGPCVAGVVGLTMPRYCLFGDTVNTASRMESTGAAYRIHISEQTKKILDDLGGYHTVYRGEVELKGKGMANTYWLTGKQDFRNTLPTPPPVGRLSLEQFKFGSGRKESTNEDCKKVKNRRPVHTRVGSGSSRCSGRISRTSNKSLEPELRNLTSDTSHHSDNQSVNSRSTTPRTIRVDPPSPLYTDCRVDTSDEGGDKNSVHAVDIAANHTITHKVTIHSPGKAGGECTHRHKKHKPRHKHKCRTVSPNNAPETVVISDNTSDQQNTSRPVKSLSPPYKISYEESLV